MREKKREKNFLHRAIFGYMTIEATYIFVTALSVIMFVISVGIYKYEECLFELESCYELERSMQLGQSTAEYVELQGGKGVAGRQMQRTLQVGIWGFKETMLSIEIEKSQPDPVAALRLANRWTRTKENENRKDKSTILEDSSE